MADLATTDFTGKVITVICEGGSVFRPDPSGWTIEHPRFEEQQGRLFLVGTPISPYPSTNSWFDGATTVSISWSSVSQYVVFDSIESFRESVGKQLVQQPKTSWWGGRNRST